MNVTAMGCSARHAKVVAAAVVVAAIGLSTPDRVSADPAPIAFLHLVDEFGDFATGYRSWKLTSADARFFADYGRNGVDPWTVTIWVDGGPGRNWTLDFGAPRGQRLTVGSYEEVMNNNFREGDAPGLDVTILSRACGLIEGSFVVKEAEFTPEGDVVRFHAVFRQYCEGYLVPIYGEVGIGVPPPVSPPLPPPRQQATLSIDSDPDDALVRGRRIRYANLENALFQRGGAASGGFFVSAHELGNGPTWSVVLAPPRGQTLRPGVYEGAVRPTSQTAGAPGLDVSGGGYGCDTLSGRFVIHTLEPARNGLPRRLRATFEQHCEGAAAALFGEVTVGDLTAAPAPAPAAQPIPSPAPAGADPPEHSDAPATPPSSAPAPPATESSDLQSDAARGEIALPQAPRPLVHRLRALPAAPRAGRLFELSLTILARGRASVQAERVACSARVGASTLRGRKARRRDAFLCRWSIPRSARGSLLTASIAITVDGEEVRRSFVRRVR